MSKYTAKDIVVLEGLEAVRVRPGMYIGSTGTKGLHHLIWEVLDNSIDEALAGYCTKIDIYLNKDGSITIEDNGRGIPVETYEDGRSALEVVMTVLHAGGKFNDNSYAFSGGLHGVGISVVNALSDKVIATVKRNGKIYQQTYERGQVMTPLKVIGKTTKTGTTIQFYPDPTIFETTEFNINTIKDRLTELAYINKNLQLIFHYNDTKSVIVFKDGINEYIRKQLKGNAIVTPIYIEKKIYKDDKLYAEVEVVFTYTNNTAFELSFVNNIKTIDGGTHVQGFRSALTKAINDVLKAKNKKASYTGADLREGLNYILTTKFKNPQFESQTKDKLGSVEAISIVSSISEDIYNYFMNKETDFNKIINKVELTIKAKNAAKAAKELVMSKNSLDSALPSKLSSCTSKVPSECELFIVEGNSAGGSAKQGRDKKTQAILPLRGKVLNIEKADDSKISANLEIKSIIQALGCGIKSNIDLSKLRYHKIILMTDADADGFHIKSLLLTFFYRFMPELVVKGHVYLARPPLFKIQSGNTIKYTYTDKEKDKIVQAYIKANKKYIIQRYKGLGEMNPDQLWETTMDCKTRLLYQITVKDMQIANDMVEMMMGSKTEKRKEYIDQNAYSIDLHTLD